MKTPRPERLRTLRPRRALLALGALAAGLALGALAPAARAAVPTLDELMAQLAQVRGGQASFSEKRSVKGMDAPLLASGTLSFQAPDRFVRSTTAPKAETIAVEGNIVTLTRNGRSRTMVLDASPELEAIVESVRGTLTGNAAALKQHFKPIVTGSLAQWTLELQPLTPRLQVMLASIRLSGQRSELRAVEMRMADGDTSLMAIEPTALVGAGVASAPRP